MARLMNAVRKIFRRTTEADERYSIALKKRAMERELRAQGYSVGYARGVVSQHFRQIAEDSGQRE